MEIFRAISSSSQSVVADPSATLPRRGVIPAANKNDDTSWVLQVSPWPTMPTLRIHAVLYDFINQLTEKDPSFWKPAAETFLGAQAGEYAAKVRRLPSGQAAGGGFLQT